MKKVLFDYRRLDHKIYTHYVNIELDSGLFTKDSKEFVSKAYGWLSAATKISLNRLQKVMNNQAYFEDTEIVGICEALDIPFEFIPVYFFTEHDLNKDLAHFDFYKPRAKVKAVQDNIISVSFA